VNGKVVQKHGKDGIHAATVAGDTIGDPFKDTSGPALNILMKLMTMISLVFAKNQFNGLKIYEKWWIALIIGVSFMCMATALTLWMRAQGFGKMPPIPQTDDDEENGLLEMESRQSATAKTGQTGQTGVV